MEKIIKIDAAETLTCLKQRLKDKGWDVVYAQMKQLQTAVYVMIGGGFLGRAAAEKPKEFYLDDRTGKFPYSKQAIMNAVQVLVLYAGLLGLDPNDLPKDYFDVHNCGVW